MTRQIGSSALLKSVVILLLTCYFPWSILGHSWGILISKNSSQSHCWLLAGRIREAEQQCCNIRHTHTRINDEPESWCCTLCTCLQVSFFVQPSNAKQYQPHMLFAKSYLTHVLWATISKDRKTTYTAHNAFTIWPTPLYISKSFSNSKIHVYLKQGIVLFYPFSHGYCSKLCSLYENAWGRCHCAIV